MKEGGDVLQLCFASLWFVITADEREKPLLTILLNTVMLSKYVGLWLMCICLTSLVLFFFFLISFFFFSFQRQEAFNSGPLLLIGAKKQEKKKKK